VGLCGGVSQDCYTSAMGIGLDMVYGTVAAVSSPIWGVSLLKTGKWRTDWAGRFGKLVALPSKKAGRKRVLIHAVSVGEVGATRKLVDHLQEQAIEVVISTTTNTGFARATGLYGERAGVWVVRFPFDFSRAVGKFLDAIDVDAVGLIELEVWPNFMQACVKRSLPVAVINGRMSSGSFRGYRRFRKLLLPMFSKLAAVGTQTQDYADRFVEMGVPADRVRVLDTMKWDNAKIVLPDQVEGREALASEMGVDRSQPLVVAGSTGPGEEAMLVEAWQHWRKQLPSVQLMLVPRKPERFEEVAKLEPSMVRRSQPGRGNAEAGLFLLDAMGELGKAYSLSDVALVGRSFDGLGGSDPIEPMGMGCAVVMGPDHENFAGVVDGFLQGQAILVADELKESVLGLLQDADKRQAMSKAGQAVIVQRQGVSERYALLLQEILDAQPGSR